MYKENVIFNVPVTNNFLLFLLILAIMTSPRPPPSPQHPSGSFHDNGIYVLTLDTEFFDLTKF